MQVSLLAFTPSSFLFRVCLGEATDSLTFLTSNIPHSFYSESLLYMPASYHVNSHSMRFKEPSAPPSGEAALAGARLAAGLPESGTLFCSYNQFFKIDEGILRAWSAILARDPSSWLVLVKFMFYEYAGPRLSRMIGERGAREGQLMLVEKKGTGEHIERSALMDLHLDTRSLISPQFLYPKP
jgi:predicted O-linked N-acetylglucosamine transferase (SPINDLY family)